MTDPTFSDPVQETAALTKQLNEGLDSFERHLANLHLGISIEVPLNAETLLGFGKMDQDWRLYARKNEPKSDRRRLTELSRQSRIAVVPLLESLKAAMLEESLQQINALKQAVRILQGLNGPVEFNESSLMDESV